LENLLEKIIVGFDFPLCPAPSIGDRGGESVSACLSAASSDTRRHWQRRAGLSEARAFSFGSVFYHVKENERDQKNESVRY
jgi:hypothetical protein